MTEAYAHQQDRLPPGNHLSLVVEPTGDVLIGLNGEIQRPPTAQSTVKDRFAEFCRRNQVEPRAVTSDTRHDFASAVHTFVADDVSEYLRDKTGKEDPVIGIMPRDMVEKKLALFYEQRDPAESDRVRRSLAERAQNQYLVLADSFQDRLKEVRAIGLLQVDFRQCGYREAATAMLDLKTAYGMTISVFRHRAAMAGHSAVSHTTTAES